MARFVSVRPSVRSSTRPAWTPVVTASITACIMVLPMVLSGLLVCGDHALVDAPGRFDLHVMLVGEQRLDPGDLVLGEEGIAGVQGAAGYEQRVSFAPSMAVEIDLDTPPADVQRESAHELRPRSRPVTPLGARRASP